MPSCAETPRAPAASLRPVTRSDRGGRLVLDLPSGERRVVESGEVELLAG